MENKDTQNIYEEKFINKYIESFIKIAELFNKEELIKEYQLEYLQEDEIRYTKRTKDFEDLLKKISFVKGKGTLFAIHWSSSFTLKDKELKINEIVIDLDEETIEKNKELLKLILIKLKELKIKEYYIKTSGNKGFHIIVAPTIKKNKRESLIAYLKSLAQSGKKIDFLKINSNNTMIRAPFSYNLKGDKFSEIILAKIVRNDLKIEEIPLEEQVLIVLEYYNKVIPYLKEMFNELVEKQEQKQEEEENKEMNTLLDIIEITTYNDVEKLVSFVISKLAEEILFSRHSEIEDKLFKFEESLQEKLKEHDSSFEGKILAKIIKENVVVKDDNVFSISYYLLLYINGMLTIKKIETKAKKEKEDYITTHKIKEEILKTDKIESFGLFSEEGVRKLYIKYINGVIQEITSLNSKPELKEILIKWLEDNDLIIDLVNKYGVIWKNNKEVILNIVDDYIKINAEILPLESDKVKDKYKRLSEKIGSYNPNKRASQLFLPLSFAKMSNNSFYSLTFLEHLLEGVKKDPIVKVVVGYSFATLLKDLIKENSILPVIPNIWLYSSIPNTGKTTLLHIVRVINLLKEFETGVTLAQVRNLLSIRNNVVVIDDIENFGGNDIKKIISSWLKAASTQSITITLGTGEQYTISSPIATTSNYHPKDVLDSDEALLQRIILLNINKTIVSSQWLANIHKKLPKFSIENNLLALGIYIINRLRDIAKEIDDLNIELLLIKERIQKTVEELISEDSLMKNKYLNGYKYLDERFLSFVTFVYYGLWLFSKIYQDFLREVDFKELIRELAEVIIENNEVYSGENMLSSLIPLLLESHNLNNSEKTIISNLQVLKETVDDPFIPIIYKLKDFYFLTKSKSFVEAVTREAKLLFGTNYTFYKIVGELRNAGIEPSYQTYLAQRKIVLNNQLKITENKTTGRFIKIPQYLLEQYLKQLKSYIVIDLNDNEIKVFGEEESEEQEGNKEGVNKEVIKNE